MARNRSRVVWFEGMTLDPHHFQQWDRYVRGILHARIQAVAPFDWGVMSLEIDRDRLANGELVVVRCTGVLPDGLVIDIPETDEPPPPRNVQDYFAATDNRMAVHLASPAERQDGGNFLLQGSPNRRETRYHAETISVQDETSGADLREVEVARARFQIRFGNEPLHDYTTIHIGEVLRNPSGVFVLNEEFVPSCLTVTASERLQTLTRRLLELLVAKSESLMERYRSAAQQREMSPADVMALGLLSTVNTYIPLMNHHHAYGESHPEDLFTTMLALAGRLSAYLPQAAVSPRSLPAYDHGDLSSCFNMLGAVLLDMLGGARVQANYVELPLEEIRPNLYRASVGTDLLEAGQFFLVARSQQFSEGELINELPMNLRIASPQTIDAVLGSYVRALTIEHTHRLPSALPVDGQANYFQLQKRGPFWEAIRESQALAIFVPDEFAEVNLQLVAVQSP